MREVREAVGRPFYPLGIKQLIAPARIVRRCLPEGEAVTLEERDERSPEIVRFVLCFAPGLSLVSPVCKRVGHREGGHDERRAEEEYCKGVRATDSRFYIFVMNFRLRLNGVLTQGARGDTP